MRHHDGKSFIAPDRLLKAEVAKYIPNMQGYTYAESWLYHDTTKVLRDKVSIFTVANSKWALDQITSFVGDKENPKLQKLLAELKDQGLQRVSMSVSQDLWRGLIVRMSLPYARKNVAKEEDWGRTFVMRRGVDRDLLESFGVVNWQVGHVFLIDRKCRIRWAGNGPANDEERASLVRLARRLVESEAGSESGRKSTEKKKSIP